LPPWQLEGTLLPASPRARCSARFAVSRSSWNPTPGSTRLTAAELHGLAGPREPELANATRGDELKSEHETCRMPVDPPMSHTELRAASGHACPSCHDTGSVRLPFGTGAETASIVFRFALHECSGCGLVRIEHLMTDDAIQDYRAAFYAALNERFAARQSSSALKHFARRADYFSHLPRGRVLDVGCERGYFLQVMRRRGWDVEGVEPYKPFAASARAVLGASVHNTGLEDVPRLPTYDLVTLWHVLEHFPDPVDALRHCRDVLKPGGVLFFEVPNIDGLGPALAGHYWPPFREPTHRWFLGVRSLPAIVRAAGLVLEEAGPASSPGDWYGFKRGIQSRIKGFEHHEALILNRSLAVPIWRRTLASALTVYPLMKLAAWVGDRLGRGEVIRAWCRRPGTATGT
jgi:2-polyprenyl-3-methyl-5-hydroxy-6-metoxy-1,4-benzoquinol methylase